MQHDVAACLSMLQPDMLPPVRASCSRTCYRLFEHVAAGHVAACSSMLQLEMLPPLRACCSRDRIFSSHLVQTSLCAAQASIGLRYSTSRCSTGLCSVDTSRRSSGPCSVEKSRRSCLGMFRCSSCPCNVIRPEAAKAPVVRTRQGAAQAPAV
jgi:hypothetical protein